jgi:hypothetical protein
MLQFNAIGAGPPDLPTPNSEEPENIGQSAPETVDFRNNAATVSTLALIRHFWE